MSLSINLLIWFNLIFYANRISGAYNKGWKVGEFIFMQIAHSNGQTHSLTPGGDVAHAPLITYNLYFDVTYSLLWFSLS